MNALVYLRRPVALTLKPRMQQRRTAATAPVQWDYRALRLYVRTHPGKGNKPLHDLRIER